jgi:hypothetical protein
MGVKLGLSVKGKMIGNRVLRRIFEPKRWK